LLDELKQKTKADSDAHTFRQVGMRSYIATAKPIHRTATGGDRIAVVYAEGVIVDGEGEDEGQVGGDRFARELRRIREDDAVKAVVLRVNSPGGSANASEVIQRELRLLKEEKPLIVSMGTVAASGGYWISAYSDRLYAQPNTITGSIGVIGVQFNVKELSSKIGVSFDVVKTGKFADSETISRPKTEEELRAIQGVVDWLYESFIDRVAEGRKLDRAEVAKLAQGRVWSGVDAKRLGLIDEFGGLETAIDFAAQKAKLGRNYRLDEFPRKREFAEVLKELFEQREEYFAKGGLPSQLARRVRTEVKALEQFNDPRGAYFLLPVGIHVN
jgi:protease-4